METNQVSESQPLTAGDIAQPITPISSFVTCAEVLDLLIVHPDVHDWPVIESSSTDTEGGRIIGLVNRQEFILAYTAMYGRELYGRRPITALMDCDPVRVAQSLSCETLNQILVSGGRDNMRKGFIVLSGQTYIGTGNLADVLSAVADIMSMRAIERDIALNRVEQANVAKTNFLASMSHELRAPLNAILGFADLVRKETFGPIAPPNYREYVEDIFQSGHHLLSMINEILDMAKIEAGRFEIVEEAFDPEMMLARVNRMMSEAAAKADVRLLSDIDRDTLPMIRAGERHLQQIVLNLLSNAVKFTEPGGQVVIDARLNDHGDFLITISDTGIGIAPSMIEKVFDPFEQVENSLTRTRAGTGLGLPLARAMTEAYGGTLYLTSELGVGTRVYVLLPASRVCHDWSSSEAAYNVFVA